MTNEEIRRVGRAMQARQRGMSLTPTETALIARYEHERAEHEAYEAQFEMNIWEAPCRKTI